MRRKRRKREGDNVSSRFLIVVAVGLVAFGLIATPAIASASSPPWWVTTVGAVGGGIAGTIATGGTPIGAIAGATAGALLADYLYSITQTQSKGSSGFTTSQETQYLNSVTNSTIDTLILQNASAITQKDLTTTSYYYFAQLMDTMVPYFLSNSTLNETYMGWDSGLYASLDNLSISEIYPLNTVLFNYYNWLAQNSYPSSSATTFADWTPSVVGSQIAVGNYYFITSNNNFYFQSNFSMTLKNIVNGTSITVKYNVNQPLAIMTYESSGGPTGAITQAISTPTIVNARQLGIVSAEYMITALSTSPRPMIKSEYSGTFYTNPNPNVYTDAIQLTSTGSPDNNYVISDMSSFSGTDFIFGEIANTNGPVVQYSNNFISNIQIYISEIYSMINNAYTSANAYFNQLKSLGYNSASQVPPSLLYVTPSIFVPTAILNSTFNATELQSLYIAYLLQLKSWLNETSKHTLQANMTIDNTTFDNGFVQVYGNLEQNVTSAGVTTHHYYNNTWFVPLINLGHWPFKVGTWTNITNNSPDPNFLVVSGTDSGTLINVVNGTFYTEAISVNGTSVASYTISPVTISYVLPQTVQIGKLSNGGFFMQKEGPLATWEWILIGLISLVAVVAIFERRD